MEKNNKPGLPHGAYHCSLIIMLPNIFIDNLNNNSLQDQLFIKIPVLVSYNELGLTTDCQMMVILNIKLPSQISVIF